MKCSNCLLILFSVVYFLSGYGLNSSFCQDEIDSKRLELAFRKIPLKFQKHPEFLQLQLEDVPANVELIQFRTKDQRTFVDAKGNYYTQKTGGYYNYLRDGFWLSIQDKLTFDRKSNRIGIFG